MRIIFKKQNYSIKSFISVRTVLLVFIITGVSSCAKYLDEKSDNSLTVPSTLKELQGLLDDGDIMNFRITPSFGEASADDYYLNDARYNAIKPLDKDAYKWTVGDYFYPNDWSSAYLPVYNSNFVLETIEKIGRTSQNELAWDNVKGSALFFRAYYYLNLLWVYSKAYDETTSSQDLGIVLRLTSDFNVKSSRSSVEQSYQQVIKDVKDAIPLLPVTQENLYRPSKAAAYGLLARAYLSMRRYDEALEYANLCLSIKDTLLDYNDPSVSPGNNVPFLPFNPEIIFYTTMNRHILSHAGGNAIIEGLLYDSYHDDDLRKATFFRPFLGGRRFKGSYDASTIGMFTGMATDEIYLIRAECYARKSDKTAALADLNALMRKRWINTVPYPEIDAIDAADALAKILTERRKELLMRGLRWSDLKRLNKEDFNKTLERSALGQTYTLPPNDNRYTLPLPRDIIDQSDLTQNPR